MVFDVQLNGRVTLFRRCMHQPMIACHIDCCRARDRYNIWLADTLNTYPCFVRSDMRQQHLDRVTRQISTDLQQRVWSKSLGYSTQPQSAKFLFLGSAQLNRYHGSPL